MWVILVVPRLMWCKKRRCSSFVAMEMNQGVASEWFTKECIGSITTWDNMVKKFVMKFHHLSDHYEEEETEEDDNPNEMDNVPKIFKIKGNLFDIETPLGPEEPWLENGVPYQLCDHICEPYRLRMEKLNGPRVIQWYDELVDEKLKEETLALKAKVKGSWGDAALGVNAHKIALFNRNENFKRGPYANMKTEKTRDPYLDINHIFGRSYKEPYGRDRNCTRLLIFYGGP
ncbi:hypothetical protein Tco_0066410 [Tanacetum coccineum]